VYDATALYSKDGRFRLRDIPSVPDEILSYGGDAAPLEFEIPVAARQYRSGTDVDPAPFGLWDEQAFVLKAHTARRTATRRIAAEEIGHDDREFIDRAVGHIHELTFSDGHRQKFQFAGWYHRAFGDSVEVSYSWVADPGTKLGDNFVALRQIHGPTEQTGATRARLLGPVDGIDGIPPGGFEYEVATGRVEGGFLRKPFHSLGLLMPADHSLEWPIWINVHMGHETAGPGGTLTEWVNFPGLL
jgi:hypothetical protein